MKRNRNFIYRITYDAECVGGEWEVLGYLDEVLRKEEVGTSRHTFSDNNLPTWIRKDIALLNLVTDRGDIKGLGHRIGDIYWLSKKNLSEEAGMNHSLMYTSFFVDNISHRFKEKSK